MKKIALVVVVVVLLFVGSLHGRPVRAIIVEKKDDQGVRTGILIGDAHVPDAPDLVRYQRDQINDLFKKSLDAKRALVLLEVPQRAHAHLEKEGFELRMKIDPVLRSINIDDVVVSQLRATAIAVFSSRVRDEVFGAFDAQLLHAFNLTHESDIKGIDERAAFLIVNELVILTMLLPFIEDSSVYQQVVAVIKRSQVTVREVIAFMTDMVAGGLDDLNYLENHYGQAVARQIGISALAQKLRNFQRTLPRTKALYVEDSPFFSALLEQARSTVAQLKPGDDLDLIQCAARLGLGKLLDLNDHLMELEATMGLFEWRALAQILKTAHEKEVFGVIAGFAHTEKLAYLLAADGYHVVFDSGIMLANGHMVASEAELARVFSREAALGEVAFIRALKQQLVPLDDRLFAIMKQYLDGSHDASLLARQSAERNLSGWVAPLVATILAGVIIKKCLA